MYHDLVFNIINSRRDVFRHILKCSVDDLLAVILSFTCVIFLGWSMGVGFGLGLNAFSIIMLLFMNALELLVAFVQAYVFTMLSAVFIGLAHKEHHAE